uniref:Uncharacterized protein n=1 Tax=Arundo donax TaxID=35708 RepID=A0A0A8YCI3_ARUDO
MSNTCSELCKQASS